MNIKNHKEKIIDNLYLVLIIVGIWLTLIGLFIFVKIYVTNLTPNVIIITPIAEKFWDFITAGVQFLLTVVYILGGLYFWYRVIKLYFWKRMKKSGQFEDEKNNIISEK
ncbi:MAG: hypothetical protein ACTSPY_05555 [Candidatus Helarchaeota archaeon]